MTDLSGRVAIVTGGSRGIGRSIVEHLARSGCRVAVVATTEESARKGVAAAEEAGGEGAAYAADVRDAAVRYRAPARLDDELQATARIVKVRGAALVFGQSVVRGDEVLAEGELTIACVDRAGVTPRRLPLEMVARINDLSA